MTCGSVLDGQKERREQIACSGNEDATMDKELRPDKTMSERKSYKSRLNVNIPETENIKLKRRGQHFQKIDGHG